MAEPIFKICGAEEWAQALESGVYRGSAADLADGFIHFSTGAQLAGTAARHFAGRRDLVLAAVDPDRLGPELRWEPARRGDLFPHLYGHMPVSAVLWHRPLPLGPDGVHSLPAEPAR
ncbi:MAG: DUF952 domain-containing protein [Hyphomicrobiales bacterium]